MKRKLQVFVSSTFSDLRLERQAAVEAILKAGHIPAGMELFTAGDKSQMKTIERWIDESDVYMLILGGRYGSIEPTTNVSYTELEYDYAREQGKPSFAVVIEEAALEEKIRSHGTDFMEKENRKELVQFREKVLGNISSFFSDTKDIKLCVHESLSDHIANPDLKGWISATEIEDTKILADELKKLRDENAALLEQVRESQKSPGRRASPDSEAHAELTKVLKAIDIKVPAALNGGEEYTATLFEIGYNNRDALINGVTNNSGASEVSQFYYFNILPKLQAHGLADNEKVPGVRYRRSFLNRAGQKFFSEAERLVLLAKIESGEAKEDVSSTSSSEDVSLPKAQSNSKAKSLENTKARASK